MSRDREIGRLRAELEKIAAACTKGEGLVRAEKLDRRDVICQHEAQVNALKVDFSSRIGSRRRCRMRGWSTNKS